MSTLPSPEARRAQRRIVAVTSLAVALTGLDLSIGNVAFESLHRDFRHISPSGLSWVLNGYTLAYAGGLLVAGRLADRIGRRRVFLAGLALFTAASLVVTVAPNVVLLVAARAVQGLGAALLTPSSLALLVAAFRADQRQEAVGRWASFNAVSVIAGPVLGAALVGLGSWRYGFAINLPLGLIALVVGARTLPPDTPPRPEASLDVAGSALVTVIITAVVLAIVEGPRRGWSSALVVTSLAIALVAVLPLVYLGRTHPEPSLHPSLFRSRPAALANVATVVYGIGFFALFLGSILFLQQVWHVGELKAGLGFAPGPLCVVLFARRVGRLADRVGAAPPVIASALVMAGAMAWRSTLGNTHDWPVWIATQALAGIAVALSFPVLNATALVGIGERLLASATALNQTARQVGGSIGVALTLGLLANPLPTRAHGFQTSWVVVAGGFAAMAVCILPLLAADVGEATEPVFDL
ncbi:MAG: hypothetical protein NVS1B12_16940 [Acidimicrobiales bacterium]